VGRWQRNLERTPLGHKRIDETMIYVHVAEAHHRELPEIVREAARGIDDPDARVLAMLGSRGRHVAAKITGEERSSRSPLLELCERGDSNPAETIPNDHESRGLAVVSTG